MKVLLTFFSVLYLFSCTGKTPLKTLEEQNLVFNEFSTVWDEAIPLGNGMVGNLVWQKNGKLRFSLDRADLWDLRPIEHIDFTKWKFQGEKAAEVLRIFARCFCLENPFKDEKFSCNKSYTTDGQTLIFKLEKGESVLLK